MKKTTKVRLQDIAVKANLSISAVSLALRNHPTISEESKQRVQQISRELGYRPTGEQSGNGTPTRSTLKIAYCLVGESLQDEAYAPIVHGIISACRTWQAHLAIEQIPIHNSHAVTVTMPTGELPDGYLLVGFLSDELIENLDRKGKPFIVIGSNELSGKHSTVTVNVVEAGEMVAKRAIEEGYRNFVNIAANLSSLHNIQFLKGARRMLEANGFSLDDDHVVIASDFALHEPKYLDHLSRLFTQPTAILIPGQVTANSCASILNTKGWINKKKVEIYALRQSDEGDINPYCKSLNLGFDRLGKIAVDRLVQKILHYETYQGACTNVLTAEDWLDSEKPA